MKKKSDHKWKVNKNEYDDNTEIINLKDYYDVDNPEENEYYEPEWQQLTGLMIHKADIERMLDHANKYGSTTLFNFFIAYYRLLNGVPARIKYKKDNELFKEMKRNVDVSAESYMYRKNNNK